MQFSSATRNRALFTVSDLDRHLSRFATDHLRAKSRETVGTYTRSLRAFREWISLQGGSCLLVREEVERYRDYLSGDRCLSDVSVSTYLTALRSFCQYLQTAGVLAENPARTVKGNSRPGDHSRKTLQEGEIASLARTMNGSDQLGKRDAAIVHLMLHAGLSEIEIVRANVSDLEYTLYGTQLRVQGKGRRSKDQRVPLEAPVMDRLAQYLRTRKGLRPADPMFVVHGRRNAGERLSTRAMRSRITMHMAAAGISREGVTPHSLTHTAPLIWLNEGMEAAEVSRRMRHGSIATTHISVRKQERLQSRQETSRVPAASDPGLERELVQSGN